LKKILFAAVMVLAFCAPAMSMDDTGQSEYGRVVINNHSQQAGLSPVVFDHWLHRSLYTCRLCHVDIGFAMEAGESSITAESNEQGFHCGACHNGKYKYGDKVVFASCVDKPAPADSKRCVKCHSMGWDIKMDYVFSEYTKNFPTAGAKKWIDWEEAERQGFIKPVDYIEGVSVKRAKLKPQEDFSIQSKGSWMSDVIFSHKKHAVWNGCEVCHPDIFPTVEKGATKYSMLEIYDGQYCGVCHNKVAFPLLDCQRCHTNPVQ